MIDKKRLEAFTDAIMAIASTIMVLELKMPEEITIDCLLSQWSIFLSYLISFILIYIMWLNHYTSFKKIENVSIPLFFINGLWILALTLVPFTTSLVGNQPNNTLSEVLYACVLLFWEIIDHVMDRQIVKENEHLKREKRNTLQVSIPMYTGFSIAIIFAFIKPILCLVIILWILLMLTIHFFHQRKELKLLMERNKAE